MKINDVLDCINRTLEEEREVKGLPKMLGHFLFRIGVEKGMGTIKMFHTHIEFFNMKVGAAFPVVVLHHTMPCPMDKLEEAKELVSIRTLENFFRALRFGKGAGEYENYVNGTFQGWS